MPIYTHMVRHLFWSRLTLGLPFCFVILTSCLEKDGKLDVDSFYIYDQRAIRILPVKLLEGGLANLKVEMNFSFSKDVCFHLRSQGGTAVANTDYLAIDEDVCLPAGTTSMNIPMTTFSDATEASDRNVLLKLSDLNQSDVVFYGDTTEVTIQDYSPQKIITGVTEVAISNLSVCAVSTDGKIRCWGDNAYGAVGAGPTSNQFDIQIPHIINADTHPVALSATEFTTCGLYSDGRTVCWGRNRETAYSDFLGQWIDWAHVIPGNVDQYVFRPQLAVKPGSGLESLSLASWIQCGLNSAGGVSCWGTGADEAKGNVPLSPTDGTVYDMGFSGTITQVSMGLSHGCYLLNTGAMYCWGSNHVGQLGNASTTLSYTPVPVSGLSSGVQEVRAGSHSTCALKTNGEVWCWGGSTGATTPFQIPIPAATSLSQGASTRTCAVLFDGRIACWPLASYASLVANLEYYHLGSTAKKAFVGGDVTCAVTDGNGDLYCWGDNRNGQIPFTSGSRFMLHPSDPTATKGLKVKDASYDEAYPTLYSGLNAKGCVIRESNDTVACWGTDGTYDLNSLVDVLSSAKAVSVGNSGMGCATLISGGVRCWDNTSGGYYPWTTIPPGLTSTNVVDLVNAPRFYYDDEANNAADWEDSVDAIGAVDNTGKLWVLGPGSAAAQVVSGTGVVSRFVRGWRHNCIIVNKALKCWGHNDVGQLGTGASSVAPILTPTSVSLGAQVIDVAIGEEHSCALLANKEIKCWGSNEYGQLGDPTVAQSSLTPVTVTGLDVLPQAIAAGRYHTCLLDQNGAVKCWGRNNHGQIGVSDFHVGGFVSSPMQVVGLELGVKKLVLKNTSSCAITDLGYLKCWGYTIGNTEGAGTVDTPKRIVRDD